MVALVAGKSFSSKSATVIAQCVLFGTRDKSWNNFGKEDDLVLILSY